jgi:uncharacterized protein YegP (UPF0339 family)
MRRARFVIYQDKAGEWRWRLLAPNNRTIADSGEGYERKGGAIRAAKMVSYYVIRSEIKREL